MILRLPGELERSNLTNHFGGARICSSSRAQTIGRLSLGGRSFWLCASFAWALLFGQGINIPRDKEMAASIGLKPVVAVTLVQTHD